MPLPARPAIIVPAGHAFSAIRSTYRCRYRSGAMAGVSFTRGGRRGLCRHRSTHGQLLATTMRFTGRAMRSAGPDAAGQKLMTACVPMHCIRLGCCSQEAVSAPRALRAILVFPVNCRPASVHCRPPSIADDSAVTAGLRNNRRSRVGHFTSYDYDATVTTSHKMQGLCAPVPLDRSVLARTPLLSARNSEE